MFLKSVILLLIGAIAANRLQDTPEDLRNYFNDIDTEVRSLQTEALTQILLNAAPLETNISNAEESIIENMTVSAKGYWATIRSLEETAEAQGQDISDCINLGENELNTLNNSIINPAYDGYDHFNTTGYEILEASSSESFSVIKELDVLGQVVALCNDEIRATSLMKTVQQYYQRAKNALIDAETKANNYLSVYLPDLLAQYELDSKLYVSNYTLILEDVTNCINNL